ncbi:hypothetical protein [Caminibacter sp.]
MKKSITLFVTLIFLIIGILIISSILKTYEKATSVSFAFISQNSKIIQNIKTTLKNSEINQTISFFYKPLFFSSKNGDFRAEIEITPICSININDYLKDNKINKNIDALFDYLADKYNIADILYLKDLILDSIDRDDKERSPFSEIKLQNPKFIDGGIYSYSQLKEILDYYAKKRNDKSVFLIKWKKLFNFTKTQLFKECINKTILNLNDENVTDFNIITYDTNISSFIVGIDVAHFLKNEHKLKILYDLKKKKAVSIEENPLY